MVLQSASSTVEVTNETITCNAEPPPIQIRAEDGTQVAIKKRKMPIPSTFPLIKYETPEVDYVSLCPLFDTSL